MGGEGAEDEGEGAGGPPAGPPRRTRSPAGLVRASLVFYGALSAVALLWRGLASGATPLYADPAAAAAGIAPLRDPLAGALAAALVLLVSDRFTRGTQLGERLARDLAAALGPLGPGQCLVLALASGLGEELFFRGALQPAVGLVPASVLFGLAHLPPRRSLWPWTVFALLAGFGLGALFAATGNLVAPVFAHVGVNAVNLRRLVREYGAPPAGG